MAMRILMGIPTAQVAAHWPLRTPYSIAAARRRTRRRLSDSDWVSGWPRRAHSAVSACVTYVKLLMYYIITRYYGGGRGAIGRG